MWDKGYIQSLLDNYFEGFTSLREEEILREYFQKESLPENFEMYKPLFQYFSHEIASVETSQAKPSGKRNSGWLRSVSVRLFGVAAAACFALFMGFQWMFHSPNQLLASSRMYIDGKKYTDIEQIQTETLKALEDFSEKTGTIYSSQVEALDFFFDNN